MEKVYQVTSVFVWALFFYCTNAKVYDEENGKLYLKFYDSSISKLCHEFAVADWNYLTDITKENQEKMVEVGLRMKQFRKAACINITQYDWQNFTDESTKRQFDLASSMGSNELPDHLFIQLKNNISKMEEIYSTTKICKFNNPEVCNQSLAPEIDNLFMKSTNYEERLDAWKQWHDKVGQSVKPYFKNYFELSEKEAKLNRGLWRYPYEDLYNQLKPFYFQLHAYIRRKLVEIYGEGYVSPNGPLPSHLLGDVWAADWSSLYNITKPIQIIDEGDVTTEMVNQNYTVEKMFLMAEDFFISLGMDPIITDEFWKNSILKRPKDRKMVCHASAWDFCNGHDFRIKMCAKVRYEDLKVVHHEMGHIQYFQQYKNQPFLFRKGANSGFHEAIGDVIALSVDTKNHLAKFNLISNTNETAGEDINFLFKMALRKLAHLPLFYTLDYWHRRVFREDIPESKWNEGWWKMRREYQGIEPALPRKAIDFDPGAIFHVASNVPVDRYFVAGIIQFQFHKALCQIAGEYNASDPTKPLHHCDIYNNTDAGYKLSEAMKLGASKPWQEVMQLLVGKNYMSVAPLMEYFKPLIDYLVSDNEKHNVKIGWE